MPTATEFAYLAGLIDGEGTVALHRHPQYKRDRIQYRPRVLVVNTHRGVLEHLRTVFGGSITMQTKGITDLYQWRVVGMADVKRILDGCMPFLIIKRERAEHLLRFVQGRLECRRGAPYTAEDEAIYQCIRSLNVRGAAAVQRW